MTHFVSRHDVFPERRCYRERFVRECFADMKKTLVSVAVAAALASGAYVLGSHQIGATVEEEVKAFEASLAALDSVQVHRLSYDRRLFDGRVDYDLVLKPAIKDPALAELGAVLDELLEGGVRLTGSLDVRHGPWLGDGFGLARANGGLALPEAWRKALPNYPGQRLLVELQANMNMSREVTLDFAGTDYRGRLSTEQAEAPADLVFSGLKGDASLTSDLSRLAYSVRLDELSVSTVAQPRESAALKGLSTQARLSRQNELWVGSVEGGLKSLSAETSRDELTMQLGELRFKADMGLQNGADGKPRQSIKGNFDIDGFTLAADDGKLVIGTMLSSGTAVRQWPNIWLGDAQLSVDGMSFESDEVSLKLGKASMLSKALENAGALEQEVTLELASAALSDIPMGQLRLRLEAKGFDIAALDALIPVLEQLGYDESAIERPDVMLALQTGAQRILAGTPMLAIEPLALSFGTPDDLSLSFRLGFDGDASVNIDDIAGLLDRLQIDASVTIGKQALNEVARISLEVEALEAGQSLTPQQKEAEQKNRQEELLAMLSAQPLLQDEGARFVSSAALRNGTLLVNGEAMPDLNWFDLMGLAGNLFGGSGGDSAFSGFDAEAAELDYSAEPLFGHLSLRAGFEPDPQEVSVGAGGSALLTGELGEDCIGHVNASQPDVSFDYVAAGMPLFVYADSDDDITLIVRTPDGTWQCNDDAPGRGLNPGLVFATPQSGRYAVWVGTLSDETAGASVYISEVAP